MKHHIIVKYNEYVPNKREMNREIEALFQGCEKKIDGVRSVTFHRSCIDESNRYDLMIVLDIDKDKLPLWAESGLHQTWKSEYARFLESKCIFDYED